MNRDVKQGELIMFKELQEKDWKYYVKESEVCVVGVPKAEQSTLIVPETLGGYPVVEVVFYMASLRGYSSIHLSKNIKNFDACCLDENVSNISIDENNKYFSVKNGILYSKDFKKLVSFPPAKKDFNASCLDDVEIIGDGAFCCCDSFVSLVIPDSVKEIGDFAFARSETLEYIEMPDSVDKVGAAVFCYTPLKNIKLSKNIHILDVSYDADAEGEGFFHCCNFETLTLPNGIEEIRRFAFYECEKLSKISIPSSVKIISDLAFDGCSSLQEIIIDKENKYFYTTKEGLYDANNKLIFKYIKGE